MNKSVQKPFFLHSKICALYGPDWPAPSNTAFEGVGVQQVSRNSRNMEASTIYRLGILLFSVSLKQLIKCTIADRWPPTSTIDNRTIRPRVRAAQRLLRLYLELGARRPWSTIATQQSVARRLWVEVRNVGISTLGTLATTWLVFFLLLCSLIR